MLSHVHGQGIEIHPNAPESCASLMPAFVLLCGVCAYRRFDPAITAVPLMTTCVDSTGLVIYFYIAKLVLGINDH